MDTLNLTNMMLLASVPKEDKKVIEVAAEGVPPIYCYDLSVTSSDTSVSNVSEAIAQILFAPNAAELRKSSVLPDNFKNNADKLDIILCGYLGSLPPEIYAAIDISGLSIVFRARIDSKKYLVYMKDSDVLLAAILHQWLDHRFMNNAREIIQMDYLLARFSERLPDMERGVVLQHILKLVALGYININITAYFNDNETSHNKEKKLNDRFRMAAFISDTLRIGNPVKIISDSFSIDMDCRACNDLFVVKGYFMELLGDAHNLIGISDDAKSTLTGYDEKAQRLIFFSGIKQLHLKFFREWYTEDKEAHVIDLRMPDYLRNMYIYKMSGMDIVDIAILSQLKIKKMQVRELCGKLNYTDAEVYRSVFAMLILGLVAISGENDGIDTIMEKKFAPVPGVVSVAPNKSFMSRILERIKTK